MFTRFFPILGKLKALKTHGRLMWHAFRHADTPKWIKGVMLATVAYLFSPIDLIPDFLVILGWTDDLVVVTASMWFLGKVIPETVKNSLPMPATQANKGTPAKTAPLREQAATPVKTNPLKPFGLVLLSGLLLAAVASHPWVQAQFASIGAFF